VLALWDAAPIVRNVAASAAGVASARRLRPFSFDPDAVGILSQAGGIRTSLGTRRLLPTFIPR
jgi:hypothetical protein